MSRLIDPSRDLLCGLLALQNGLIDQGGLFAAFAAWTRDRTRPLTEHLVELGHLDAPRRNVVEAIAGLHVQASDGDAAQSLSVLSIGRSICERLAQAGGTDVESTLGHVGSGRDSTQEYDDAERTGSFAVGSATSGGQRFRILRPHARGGLGAVFVALDGELHREVALKQILEEHADDLVSRQRFVAEAEITGGLEHPGVVPVYGLGTDALGRPYYAMRLIKGESLKEAIAQFHQVTSVRELELRRMLRRFVDVCNAVDYAHSRGVIHRDLKPANIIVGKHGETLVVDWGLAKTVGRADESTDEQTLAPVSSGSSETLPGSVLGTPGYMSPEQARGDLRRMGPRSDVYSLGATLFCLLTGKPPFEGDDVGAVLRAVQEGRFQRPSQRDPTLDKALEAVCLKAMARVPEDRYPTPKDLTDDLERWMADEPVTAWREPFARRARRWARRNRTVVAALAASVLVALLGTGAVLAVETRANGRLQQANSALEIANRRVTEANAELKLANTREKQRFNLAMEAIKLFHGEVSDDVLMKEKQFDGLRKKLLKGAADFYGKLEDLVKGQTDRESRTALGKAYVELAELTAKIGDQAAALVVHRKALAVHRELASEPAADIRTRLELARGLNASGSLQQATGDMAGALASFEQARKVAGEIGTDGEVGEQARDAIGKAYSLTGNLLAETGDPAGARAAYDKALLIQQKLAEGNPGDKNYQRNVATAENSIGLLQSRTGNPSEALAAYLKALSIEQKLAEGNPGVTEFQVDLAWSYMSIGVVLSETGDPIGARSAYDKALAIRQRLVGSNPTVTTYQEDMANGFINFGSLLSRTGDVAGARAAFGKAIEIREKLSNSNPCVIQLGATTGFWPVISS